jgi:hypothetical protein
VDDGIIVPLVLHLIVRCLPAHLRQREPRPRQARA